MMNNNAEKLYVNRLFPFHLSTEFVTVRFVLVWHGGCPTPYLVGCPCRTLQGSSPPRLRRSQTAPALRHYPQASPPGPPPLLPFIGHLHLMIRSPPYRALDRILARYEPLVYLLPRPFHTLRRRRHSGHCTGPPQARGQHSGAAVTVCTTKVLGFNRISLNFGEIRPFR
jgi:hypothetical protein